MTIKKMAIHRAFLFKSGILLSAFMLLSCMAIQAQDADVYTFLDESGEPVIFPKKVPLYWKENPGPWSGLESAHDVSIKTHFRREGLENNRVIHISLSHKNTEGWIKAIYVLDKDAQVIGFERLLESSGPEIKKDILISSTINYIEICIECSEHGMWKEIYRFA